MNNILDKIYYYLGYNNLGLILDQERKHWLMKVNKQKQIQDKNTGEIFQGTMNNLGCDIVIESEKMNINNEGFANLSYTTTELNQILEKASATFPFSISINGLSFARIISINYPSGSTHRTYRLKLDNCEECIIPIGGSNSSDAVFADRWLRTTSTPIIQVMDNNGNYSINVTASMDNCTNGVYYYPLNESLQPFPISYDSGSYYSTGINDDGYIGFPLYWFTCDELNVGPSVNITNNRSPLNRELCFFGNPGNASKYDVKMYVGIDGNNDATPDDSLTSSFEIVCHPTEPNTFVNNDSDFNKSLDITSISIRNKSSQVDYILEIVLNSNKSIFTMDNTSGSWEYVDDNTYKIDMNVFDENCLNVTTNALTPIFDVSLDVSIPFQATDTSDIGWAGIRMGSSNDHSDMYPRYPHHLNEWDGLPEWMNNLDPDVVPQHMIAYAIHNTPEYVETIPDSRQVSALILDPGKKKTEDSEELTNDERGRVYVISNDDITYRNNKLEKLNDNGIPKPDRTVARICDIPTSIMQLSGISGLSPSPVVDKKYVRSFASLSDDDKNRLWNVVNYADRWVRPTAVDAYEVPISSYTEQKNDEYVFQSPELLNKVDMSNKNDFRIIENLNSYVDPTSVHISTITNGGSGYNVGDTGKVIVGGYSFTYEIMNINEEGVATEVGILPDSEMFINLSNFEMTNGTSGITQEYGTSPNDPTTSGSGLKIRMIIEAYESLLPYKGDFLDNLHAFVRDTDGIWLYEYRLNVSVYNWDKRVLVSPFEKSSVESDEGLSTPDAYMSSIIPIYNQITVSAYKKYTETKSIKAFSTNTFINIVDSDKTPLTPNSSSGQTDEYERVDICKFRCHGIKTGEVARTKNFDGVLERLKELGVLVYDCFVIWRWNNPSDDRNLTFAYGIITRSLNNFISTDVTTKLPGNDLRYKKYVHTNQATTVVWDAPGMNGVMMWVYDPASTTVEKYVVDPNTQDLYVDRSTIEWNDIDIYNDQLGYVKIVDENGVFQWNVMTNNPYILSTTVVQDPLYQQPEFRNIISYGSKSNVKPVGNWKLVFPRCESFRLSNVTDGTTFKPVKLQMIRGENLNVSGDVYDENGNTVNPKTLILNANASGVTLNTYNPTTGTWEKI